MEGIEDDDFFVSNIDINAMNLSAFAEEEEVLFLPLSCFEVVGIVDEDFFGNSIKVIRLRYLNKYKEIISKNFQSILQEQNNDKLEKFINDGINSKYSKGICKYLGHDFNEHFYNEISRKINVELNYQPHISFQFKNSNPLGKKFIINKKFKNLLLQMDNAEELMRNAEKLLDNLNTAITSYQFGKYHGKDCIACYDERGDLAPRDVVARAIQSEILKSGVDYVNLDISQIGIEKFRRRFPTIARLCYENTVDLSSGLIPVIPTQHYFMGGIKVDINSKTTIKNLYAVGECTSTGLHGANRLASNSLLECFIFAKNLSEYLAQNIKNPPKMFDEKVKHTIDRYSHLNSSLNTNSDYVI